MDKKLVGVGSLKKGNYIIYDSIACRVVSVQTSRPGKHGHAKSRVEAIGMVDGQKRIFVSPSHDKIEVPIILKRNAQILSVAGDRANVMDMENYETFDLKVPEELKDEIKEGVTVVYWQILNDRVIKEVR